MIDRAQPCYHELGKLVNNIGNQPFCKLVLSYCTSEACSFLFLFCSIDAPLHKIPTRWQTRSSCPRGSFVEPCFNWFIKKRGIYPARNCKQVRWHVWISIYTFFTPSNNKSPRFISLSFLLACCGNQQLNYLCILVRSPFLFGVFSE